MLCVPEPCYFYELCRHEIKDILFTKHFRYVPVKPILATAVWGKILFISHISQHFLVTDCQVIN